MIEGNREKGYVRIDDPTITRVELRWEEKKSGGSLQTVVDSHIRLLKRKARRKRLPFRLCSGEDWLLRKAAQFEKAESFIWEADFRCFNIIWISSGGGRVVFLRVFSPLEEKEALIKGLFDSLEDCQNQDLWKWGIYGFSFPLPQKFQLKRCFFKTGYLEFNFQGEKEKLKIVRWAMANVLLKRESLEEWGINYLGKEFKRYGCRIKEWERRTVKGLSIEGTKRWLFISGYLRAYIWYVPQENKIYSIRGLYHSGVSPYVDKLYTFLSRRD